MPYLDHAATTPMLPEAIDAVAAAMAEVGNASSLHADGRRARRVVEEARESIAADLGAQPSDVVFTASGTESNNLVVKGLHRRARAEGRPGRIVTSVVEHHALLDPVEWLRTAEGAPVDLIPVDHHGRVDVAALKEVLDDDPAGIAVVSIMWANNEVGTVQPVHEIASLCLERGVTFHTDAVQAVGHLDVDASLPGLDALSLSAHKFGGPGGVGALVLGRQLEPEPLLHGGGQERDLRSGTLDVAGVSGMAAALRAAMADRAERTARVEGLRRRLVDVVLEAVPDAVLNGDPVLSSEHRLPGNAHFSFPGCEGDALLMLLDARGISCSTGSACSAGIAQPSHVLLAMGADDVTARSSLRFSLGHSSTEADVDAVGAALSAAVARARAAGRASGRG